jgi:protein-ribulosamine 3-kinase
MVSDVPPAVATWCSENGWGEVQFTVRLSKGDVSHALRLEMGNGRSLVLKVKPAAPADMFAREAEGLAALANANGPTIPAVYFTGPDFILLEDLRPYPPTPTYWEEFGLLLATMHLTTHTHYGFAHDNFCGETPQPNPWTESGHEFFAEHRLRHQARLARDRERLDAPDIRRIERLCERLPDLVPPQSPVLIHGDLWRGNALCGPRGEPALIDPAAHFGWAEAELAMTLLFGGFPPAFYDTYAASYPLAPGWRGRMDLYNLYHLLNHLNVFGAGYLGRVREVLGRYS